MRDRVRSFEVEHGCVRIKPDGSMDADPVLLSEMSHKLFAFHNYTAVGAHPGIRGVLSREVSLIGDTTRYAERVVLENSAQLYQAG